MSLIKKAFKFASPTDRHASHSKIFISALKPKLDSKKASEEARQISNPASDPETDLKKVLDESFAARKKHLKKKEAENQLKSETAAGETSSLNPLVVATPTTADKSTPSSSQAKSSKKRKQQPSKQPIVEKKRKVEKKKKNNKTSIFDNYY